LNAQLTRKQPSRIKASTRRIKVIARLATGNTVVTFVIFGAKRLEQLQDNLAAMELKLRDDKIKLLDEVSGAPEYPSWMFPVQSAGRLGALDRHVWDNMR
jgi:diketogulonate reductase-like aldo/keto reductase